MAGKRRDNPAGSPNVELESGLGDAEELRDELAGIEQAAEGREREDQPFVVGIGASAGGLEALGELVKHVPMDNMAFVVVQHLAPHHESVLPQLLARTSKVEVLTATDGTRAEANHVYVTPPNTEVALLNGIIRLIPPTYGDRPRLPIDYFFRTLAQDQGPSAIGVILSGTGTDGTLGLRAIKEEGGLAFVQEPSSAKYDGMPRSALSSGLADFCLTPKGIGEELARIAHRPKSRNLPVTHPPAPHAQEQIVRLFLLVRSAFGNDLTRYKPSTIERRIERRMMLRRIAELEDYVKYVQSNPAELQALYRDMLITVTNFFRDQEPFELLKTKIFPRILEQKEPRDPFRIWVPACASGEEAYSIAISLLESLRNQGSEKGIQIFGTDVDDESIQYARRGIYPPNIELDVSPDRLHRYFIKKDGEYQVSRQVRDLVVFSKQNLLRDAPFSRMDLVSCRNLLIYLQPSSQKRVLSILHYSLNRWGHLLLGSAETVLDTPELFSIVDRKNKIYAKKQSSTLAGFEGPLSIPEATTRVPARSKDRPALSLQLMADRKILDTYGPPGVLINENLDILHFRGHTGPYLNPAPGAASFSLLRLARPELHIELKRAIQQAFSDDKRVESEVKFYEAGKPRGVRLDVVPIQEPETKTRCLLVSFVKLDLPDAVPVTPLDSSETDERVRAFGGRVQELERELEVTKGYLQSTLEDMETANEELKSTNEELQSSNEELQSTNEELETSREEMQSSNEELTTVNEELQNRMTELSQTNDDLHNVLTGLDNPVIIVGMDLRVRRFTNAAERLLSMTPADLGRSVTIMDAFCGTDTPAKIKQVIETLVSVEEEVLCRNQRWYLLRITPYKTLDHAIRGAVVSLTDVDVRKRSATLTRDVGEYAGKFLGAIHHPLLILDSRLRIVWANASYYQRFQVVPEETIGANFPGLKWDGTNLKEKLEDVLRTGEPLRDHRVSPRAPANDGDDKLVLGASLIPAATESALLLISIEET